MKRQQKRFISLKSRIITAVMAVVLAVLLLCQSFLLNYVTDRMEENAKDTMAAMLELEVECIDLQIKNIIKEMYYLPMRTEINSYLQQILFGNTVDQATASIQIGHLLSIEEYNNDLISSIYLDTGIVGISSMRFATDPSYNFRQSELYLNAANSARPLQWNAPYEDEIFVSHRQVIPVTYRFTVDGYEQPLFLVFNLDTDKLYRHLISPVEGRPVAIGLCSADSSWNHIVSGEIDTGWFCTGEVRFEDSENGRVLVGSSECSAAPWVIVLVQSEDDVMPYMHQLQFLYYCTLLVGLLAILILVRQIVVRLTAPIIELTHMTERLDNKDYSARCSYNGNDEMGILANSFNTMAKDTSDYIEQLQKEKENVALEQQLKRRAELIALQSQINPHFLYNTLDSIHWKAEMAGCEDISQMTTSLATLFRIGLSRGAELIPIEQEIQHAKSYLEIQHLRYGDQLEYTISVPEELREMAAVKITLQPLVENAIYHGIKEREDKNGKISIRVDRDDKNLYYYVTDNGVGIPAEKLKILQDDLARGVIVNEEGYGIFNVNERIRLFFGPEYGLTLDNNTEGGAIACIKTPMIDIKEAHQDHIEY